MSILTARRQVYQCVARLVIPNNLDQYRRVSRVLATLRRNELVMIWDAIEDRSRRTIDKRGVSDLTTFI